MAATIQIHINNAVINAYVGIYDAEQQHTQPIKINVKASMHIHEFENEKLDTTINYEKVWQIIEKCFQQKWQLLESVAQTITKEIKSNYPTAFSISTTLVKLNAPIQHFNGEVGVTYYLD
jgi:7,8-dihydroneopterin aldolase/epimerase/oxygenase